MSNEPSPQIIALRTMLAEERSMREETLVRLVAHSNQLREMTARAEAAEARVAELSTPAAPPNVVDLRPEQDEFGKAA